MADARHAAGPGHRRAARPGPRRRRGRQYVDQLGRARKAPQTVAGFDLTFSAPKSVSVAWALADEPTRARIYAAHRRALRVGHRLRARARSSPPGRARAAWSGGRPRRRRDRVRPLGLPRRRPAAAHPRRRPQPGPGRHRRAVAHPRLQGAVPGRGRHVGAVQRRPRRRADRRARLGLDPGAAPPLGRAEVGGRRRPAGAAGASSPSAPRDRDRQGRPRRGVRRLPRAAADRARGHPDAAAGDPRHPRRDKHVRPLAELVTGWRTGPARSSAPTRTRGSRPR